MASRPRTSSRWDRKARCGLRLSRAERWRIRRIRTWANRPLKNCWTCWMRSAAMKLPVDAMFGPSTLNIGTIQGGRAPNVIPDYRESGDFYSAWWTMAHSTRAAMRKRVPRAGRGDGDFVYSGACRFGSLDGFETSVVSYTTDIPAFGGAWGQPFLFGPGSIHVAHTDRRARAEGEVAGSSRNLSKHGEATAKPMSERIPVGVLGATGMVGQEFVSFLRDHPWFELTWLGASDRSAGKAYREATSWRLGGVTPAHVRRHRGVRMRCPTERAETGVLGHGCVGGDGDRARVRAGRGTPWFRIRAIIAWMRMFRCWCRRSTRIIWGCCSGSSGSADGAGRS